MTDTIDLDELEIEEENDAEAGAYGDWFWRGEGDPENERDSRWGLSTTGDDDSETDAEPTEATGDVTETADAADAADDANEMNETDADETPPDPQPVPKVPGGPSGPVGVPESKGGSGGGSPSDVDQESGNSERTTNHGEETEPAEMTLAFTYEAINRLADPRYAVAAARGWADWIGIVGDVSTPVIRKFQRDAAIELDFFGGSENGPAQRLADVTEESMFYADRLVLVGVGDDEEIAAAADWEFVPLETAAEKADWEIEFET